MKIGILKETKTPPDRRVPFTPVQCRKLVEGNPGLELVVQPSDQRCFTDQEYLSEGLKLQEDISDCDLLLGVKEVNIPALLPYKTYMFFSHTAKEQPYNRDLLKALAKNRNTLLDYEYLTRPDKTRVVAFGRWAGIVGSYNGLKAYGERTKTFSLIPANQHSGLIEMKESLKSISIEKIKISLTGGGRVAHGALEILNAAGIREVSPVEYLSGNPDDKVFTRLDPWHYSRHLHELNFELTHYIEHPEEYENAFLPYAHVSDMYIACHFWDPKSPKLLNREDLKSSYIPIKVIADISCDINGPIASTIRASTIADPVYGYDPNTGEESTDPYDDACVTVMAVDNLPGELPRDASRDFGEALMENVIPYIIGADSEGIIKRAMILKQGSLTDIYSYLENYLNN